MLNFNKQAATHNTVCGGIVSLVIKILVFLYFLTVTKQMFSYDNDRWVSFHWVIDPSKAGDKFEDKSLIDINEMD